MRHFYSYGPVDAERHFSVPRLELVEQCLDFLVDDPDKGGHYFTIWAPRQTGKTWLMHQVMRAVQQRHGDRFQVAMMSMQGVTMGLEEPEKGFLTHLPLLCWESFKVEVPRPEDFSQFKQYFLKQKGLFSKPLLLFIDEFDSLPPRVIDRLVTLFRDIYLKRDSFLLHGLALIGVRAVLGVDSERGSPFNIQRSLHVPNFTSGEVEELFRQYQAESGQRVAPDVVTAVHAATRGQPGLVNWFGELLTTTYNLGVDQTLDAGVWSRVYRRACSSEWNNTVLNLIKKARGPYQQHVLELFTRSDIPFSIDAPWCSYLYLNGLIDKTETADEGGESIEVCRFASPFIQQRLFNALANDLMGDRTPILALEPLDDLADVVSGPELNLPALMDRYIAYLGRLRARGLNPWQGQPRRSDLHYTEYVAHFHLYSWLQNAVGRLCVISPEFPTGNGRVDLHLRCQDKAGVIEVKSFRDQAELEHSRHQAANYARNLGLPTITLALFAPVEDEDVLARLSGRYEISGVRVVVTAIGWV